jgi:hypothetical protein
MFLCLMFFLCFMVLFCNCVYVNVLYICMTNSTSGGLKPIRIYGVMNKYEYEYITVLIDFEEFMKLNINVISLSSSCYTSPSSKLLFA